MSDTQGHEGVDDAKETVERTQEAFRKAMDPEALAGMQNAMGMDPAKMQEALREMTSRSVEQSKEAYQRMRKAADEASRTLETTVESAHDGSLALSRKALDAVRSNAEMGFEHLERLAAVKSVAELIELQTGFVRRQMEVATDQAKEIQALSRDVAQELMRPAREASEKIRDR